VDSGTLGKLQLIKGAFTFTLTREDDIRSKKETGGGSLWDVGCYPISYARMIIGADPVEVFGWQVIGQGGADESFIGQMRFEGGVYVQFDSGFKSPFRSMIKIIGTHASLNIPDPFKPGRATEIYLSRGGKQEKILVKGSELYLGEVEDLCDAIILNKSPRISHKDSRGNIAVILALLESAGKGRPVTIP